MTTRSLSIRNILLITVSILTLLIVTLSIHEGYLELKGLLRIGVIKKSTFLREKFLDVIEDESSERNFTFFFLKAPDEKTAYELGLKYKKRREKVDDGLRFVLNDLRKYDLPELPVQIKRAEKQFEELKKLRGIIDRSDFSDRSKLADLWFAEYNKMIEQTQNLWMDFTKHYTTIDPIMTQRIMFKHFLGMLIDYAGRERCLIGGLIISGKPITFKEQSDLLRWQGVVENGWKITEKLTERARLTPEITPYIKDVKSKHLSFYNKVNDIFYTPDSINTKSYPISVESWMKLSSHMVDSIFVLKDVSLENTRAYIKNTEDSAIRRIVLHTILLIGALGLCGYSFWIIIGRVINPISSIVSALTNAVTGKEVSFDPNNFNDQDEIGKLTHVLKAFQENLTQLRISEERYRALIDANREVVWTWQPENEEGLATLKKWWEEVTGRPGDTLLPNGWIETLHPEDREYAGKIWGDSSIQGKNFEMEYRMLSKSGQYRHINVRGVSLKKPDGSVREFVGTLSDISARRYAEENIKKYTQDLERSNKELDDFAYIASHDLKEPLRGVHNHALFLLEDNQGKLDSESVGRLNRLIYLSQRLERLINDLLYYSRIGRQELAIQSADINEVIHDVEQTLDIFKEDKNINITISEKLPAIICDKTRVTEVFRNLITNAIKYNDSEIKNIEIGFLRNAKDKNGNQVENVFYVKDNGRGIAKEFYDEIFRIFKRLQSPKNKEEDGTGVGLTFVKKIIERHGGKIWLESGKDLGTTFYFFIGKAED